MPNSLLEIWRPIVGYETSYEVSDLGRVRRSDDHPHSKGKRPLKPYVHKKTGYASVGLCRGGVNKTLNVHVLVAKAFLGERPTGFDCAHLDGVRKNCAATNLKWATRKENHSHKIIHGTHLFGERINPHKLAERDIPEIFRLRMCGVTGYEISQRLGVTVGCVFSVLSRKTWKRASARVPIEKFPPAKRVTCRKLTSDAVLLIDRLRAEGWTCARIALVLKVTPSAVANAAARRIWKHVPKVEKSVA